MNVEIKGKSVVIIGATGGLGAAIATAFARRGARLLLAGRSEERLIELANSLSEDILTATVDLKNPESIETLAVFAGEWSKGVDILINATGVDVRKSLEDHTLQDIEDTLDTNVKGTILLTKAFLGVMKDRPGSTVLHIGGFADGRMAFPYYSVDVASRAAVYSFIESMNRELKQEGKQARLSYFCPSPADTDAERPYHELWRAMGVQILPTEKVAEALLKHIEKQKSVGIMGGSSTIFFAKLNAIMPKLADALLMKKYGTMLKSYFYQRGPHESANSEKKGIVVKVAIGLMILSTVLFALIFIVPFLELSLTFKALLVPVLIVLAEILWWIGILLVGKAAINKYRQYLNPCYWFR